MGRKQFGQRFWDSQKRPGLVQRLENGSVLVSTLRNKCLFKLLQELQRQLVLGGKGFFSHNRLHGSCVSTNGVLGVELVTHVTVVFSGHTISNGTLHQSRQGWQHVDRWIYSSVGQLSVHKDLALGNITGQVGNRVSDIVVRHGQNRNLGDRSVSTFNTTGSLVNGGQIRVHVTWVTSSTWNFFSGSRNLSQGVGVRRHVGQDGQNVLLGLVSKVLGGGQGQSWSDDSFNGWVVGQIQEQRGSVQRSVFLEILLEETRGLQIDTHSSENNTEVLLVTVLDIFGWSDQTGLSTDLGSNLVVGKTRGRENRNLLTSGNRVHGVNGRNTRGNHLFWINTSKWVNWRTVNIQVVFSENPWSVINRSSRTIKNSTQHVLGYRNLQVLSCKLNSGLLDINSRSTFKNLHNGSFTLHFQNLTCSGSSVRQSKVDNLVISWELDFVQNDKRTIHAPHVDGVDTDSSLLAGTLVLVSLSSDFAISDPKYEYNLPESHSTSGMDPSSDVHSCALDGFMLELLPKIDAPTVDDDADGETPSVLLAIFEWISIFWSCTCSTRFWLLNNDTSRTAFESCSAAGFSLETGSDFSSGFGIQRGDLSSAFPIVCSNASVRDTVYGRTTSRYLDASVVNRATFKTESITVSNL
ncbi:hypothetical protein OGAPHI_002563 [Ogataea philodendri]|uniref:Uncharacterized protein n=1 Tax=Ogataea philodendri TaxID=1378263 RepID=A0A9P8T760_9ASCO|nr:uncharacterized protein OGAPHI_002563 [Ogataea philodendri]KAH3668808.1 hypothetical protein OGAPHI_002563 [Ogataea philodendri]